MRITQGALRLRRPRWPLDVGECASPALLNKEVRGSNHDPRHERERARKQKNVDDESSHSTLPITQAPSHAAGLGHSCSLAKRRRWPVQIWASGATREGGLGLPRGTPASAKERAPAVLRSTHQPGPPCGDRPTDGGMRPLRGAGYSQRAAPYRAPCRWGNLSYCGSETKGPAMQGPQSYTRE
jgi:hypothetical protein